VNTVTQRLQASTKAADPTKFLQLAPSHNGENSVYKILDPDGNLDLHPELIVLLLVRHPTPQNTGLAGSTLGCCSTFM